MGGERIVTRMDRRRALTGQSAGLKRFCLFRDGAYQGWLNGREFTLGGYWSYASSQTSQPSYELYLNDSGVLVFTMTGAYNRTNTFSIGIKAGDLLPAPIRRIGGTIWRSTDETGEDQRIGMGVSQKFVQNADMDTAFGAHEMEYSLLPTAARECEMEITDPSAANYIVFQITRKNVNTRWVKIRELWVEV